MRTRDLFSRRTMRSSESDRLDPRAGVTIIEILVVISLISVLMALLLPAVASVRQASRRMECLSNARNLGLALIQVAETTGRFPASGNFAQYPDKRPKLAHNWVVDVLPWIDERVVHDEWDFDGPSDSGPNAKLARSPIRVLICPNDFTVVREKGGNISYVVNGGFGFTTGRRGVGDCPVDFSNEPIDFNGNGVVCPADLTLDGVPEDRLLYKQTGMFFLQNWPVRKEGRGAARYHRLADVTDGLSQTLLLSENLRTGLDPKNSGINWATPFGFRNSFFVPSDVCLDRKCSEGSVDYARANQGDSAINSGIEQAEGESPWPSSGHVGGVNVIFGDGHGIFLSQNIDGRVYAALMSPQGARIVGPLAQALISDSDF